jgi:homoserine kinase
LIAAGMHDRLHEPYRARLFPHLLPLTAAARQAGALGACLSGAGPSILALADAADADAIAAAYDEAARGCGAVGETLILRPAPCGAHVVAERASALAGKAAAGERRRS